MRDSRRCRAAMVVLVLSITLGLAACSSGPGSSDTLASTSETRSFTGDNGTVEIPVNPKRLITIGSADIFLSLGVQPVGMSVLDESFLPWMTPAQKATYEKAENVGRATEYDLDKIASLNPDLIVLYAPQRVWDKLGAAGQQSLKSIAPTVQIGLDIAEWKKQGERAADAVGRLDVFNAERDKYDQLVSEIKNKYAGVLDSMSFGFINRYPQAAENTFVREYDVSYCTVHLKDIGLKIPGQPSKAYGSAWKAEPQSFEYLGNLSAAVDVIIYSADATGQPKETLRPVLDSRIWKSLPQVNDGRAFGVKCQAGGSYAMNITNLQSLQTVLDSLAARK